MQSGIAGGDYYGNALGTFTGSFYGNTTTCDFSGTLFSSVEACPQGGNNTFCLYNPLHSASGQWYSNNHLQLTAATLYVTYEEEVGQPRVSASSVDMGSAATVYTDRLNTAAVHTISYSFVGSAGQIGTDADDSVS